VIRSAVLAGGGGGGADDVKHSAPGGFALIIHLSSYSFLLNRSEYL
jgi:hypothetical protein